MNLSKELEKYKWFAKEMDSIDLIVLDSMPFEKVNLLHTIISQANIAIEQLKFERDSCGELKADKVIQFLIVQKKRARMLIEINYNRDIKR